MNTSILLVSDVRMQIMSMYGLLKEFPEPTQQQVEDQLDGNLCRYIHVPESPSLVHCYTEYESEWCTIEKYVFGKTVRRKRILSG